MDKTQNAPQDIAAKDEATARKLRRAERSVKDYQFFILRVAIFLVAVWLLLFVFVGVVRMPSGDMYPRLDGGDLLLFYRLDKDVQAQDIIVLEKTVPEMEGKQLYVCRVVAVAGDTVEITEDQRLVINGNSVIESNIFYSTPRYEDYTEYPLTLKEGECFVLADHRVGGADSRFFGPVTKDEIDGTVITVVRRNNL